MWILTPLQPGGGTHYLLSGKEYVVGRKNCDILLPSDQSISRAHAQLTASDETLILKDTSKYGTFVNSERLTAPVSLKSGDEVTFGVFHSKFSVGRQKPVVCSSCLDNEGKATLCQALQGLGGNLVNTWTEGCTHLVMPSVKVTIKTISALLCCRPIVKPEFFSELNKAVQQKLAPPKAESFTPEIDEPSLNKEEVNLGVMPARQQLFTGKTFVFLSAKQLKRLSAAVKFGGGSSQLLEEGSLLRNLLESPQTCVIDVITGNSQTLLPPSTTEWANSVRSIVQRKGLRVITESEIGLAAIYASCDKYCNPSNLMPDSDSAPKVKPRIPSASLSQSVAVDETVLPAATQNITAYVANTETSQRMEVCEVTGVAAVGETPEKKPNQNSDRLRKAQNTTAEYVVADTMSSSLNITENSQRKKLDSKLTDAGTTDVRPQPSFPKTNGGTKASFFRQSPQKPKTSAQASPQKQSTLINFFQPVSKKRPWEDEFSDGMSEPKRPVLEPSITVHKPNTTKEISSPSLRGVSETPPESEADLFTGRREEPLHRKRKEMEAEIQMEELESIMSEDMDGFGEQLSGDQTHQSAKQKKVSTAVESSSKRQRVQREEEASGTSRQLKLQAGLEKKPSLHNNHSQRPEQHVVVVKTEPLHPTDYMTTKKESRSEKTTASTSRNIKPVQDDDASFVEDLELIEADITQPKDDTKTPLKPVRIKQEVQDLELIEADITQPKDDTKTPLKPVRIKQEVQESKMDEGLPRNQVLVEFRSLTVSTPPTTKQKQTHSNGCAKNFKCFQKNRVPGSDGFQHIIGGSDLLVHNRGKNTDLDEWLKDAAEEERQSRREEAVGDDLFRYNPTKLAKRR